MKAHELLIYEDIGGGFFGGLTAKQVVEELNATKDCDQINVRMNSSGGDVFEGVAIYNALRRHRAKITVEVEGAALSIASVIAMAADEGELWIAESAFMMVHNPWSFTMGGAEEHSHKAKLLENIKDQIVQIYAHRTGLDHGKISAMMDDETWMDGKSSQEQGFADGVTPALAVAAHVHGDWLGSIPDAVRQRMQAISEKLAAAKEARERLDKSLSERR